MASKPTEFKLAVETRGTIGTTGAHALRAAGKIPVVLYGHGNAPEHLAVEAHAFEELIHHGGRSGIVTLLTDGKARETALVREIQIHPVTRRPIHADLQRVSANERIHTTLQVVTTGVADGVRNFGAVMDVVAHELEVEGPANRIPEHLEIDVTQLGVHEHVTAAGVKLPNGFTMLTPGDTIVVAIEPSRTEREIVEAAVAPPEGAEPEVIGAQPEAEGE